MNRSLTVSILLAATLFCSGCALTTASIDVPYQSLAPASPVAGAKNIAVTVTTQDDRTENRDRVGVKKNGYGMEMAPIVASNDIPSTITSAFQQELTARGFKMGPGVALQIQLAEFYNDFKSGFFSGQAVANVSFNMKIVSAGGAIVYASIYQGSGTDPNIQLADGSNAQVALTKAFQSAVASAVDDPNFIKALITAGASVPVASAAAPAT